jgi:hypothetical protein
LKALRQRILGRIDFLKLSAKSTSNFLKIDILGQIGNRNLLSAFVDHLGIFHFANFRENNVGSLPQDGILIQLLLPLLPCRSIKRRRLLLATTHARTPQSCIAFWLEH